MLYVDPHSFYGGEWHPSDKVIDQPRQLDVPIETNTPSGGLADTSEHHRM
jgi:hypothetical protein